MEKISRCRTCISLFEGKGMKIWMAICIMLLIGGAAFFFMSPPQDTPTPRPPPRETHLSLFHYLSGSLSGGLDEMIAVVNARNPMQQVIAQPLDHEAFKSMILATLAKDSPPDLFTYWAGAKTRELVEQGKLEPIDDIWQTVPLTRRFAAPVTEAASTYHGKKYLLPITQHFVVFFYNKKLLAGERPVTPTTWPELIDLAPRLKNRGVTPFALGAKERWPAQFWFDYLLLRTAGPDYRQALMEGKASYADPEVAKVYEMWGALIKNGYFNDNANQLDWAEATKLVCSGEAAMTLMGTWAIQAFTGRECGLAEETDFDFFVFPQIDPDVPEVAVGPVDGIVLTKASANHAFAKNVLSYFSEAEPQKRLAEGSGAFAPSSEVPPETYSPLRRRLLAASKRAAHWAFNYDLATRADIADKGMDSFNELLAFPDQTEEILNHLQSAAARIQPPPRH